jgi:hypothetical protein
MKRIKAGLILILLVFSIKAQGQEPPKGDKKRDFPEMQLIRPSIPPQRYNFELHCWEKDPEWTDPPVDVTTTKIAPSLLLEKLKAGKAKRHRPKKRSNHHVYRKPLKRSL